MITLDLRELITELEIRTKMKRAPKCAVSTGLREVAIMPGSGTVVFEMPGISQRVTLLEGEVAEEIVISMKNFSGLLKWLKSFAGQETTVLVLELDGTAIAVYAGLHISIVLGLVVGPSGDIVGQHREVSRTGGRRSCRPPPICPAKTGRRIRISCAP